MTRYLWRVQTPSGPRWANSQSAEAPERLLRPGLSLAEMLNLGPDSLADLAHETGESMPERSLVLAPVEHQPVWAAGVTYRRSMDARLAESQEPSVYDKVYSAARPELFYKSSGEAAVGPHGVIRIRSDSPWNVPEPELAAVINAKGEICAYTIGDDVSSRSIEGENPLYLPQAKMYDGALALGPCLVPAPLLPDPLALTVTLEVFRGDQVAFSGSATTQGLRRHPEELVAWLRREIAFPSGVVLLTGASIVPQDSFTLQGEDRVSISIDGMGTLLTTVSADPFCAY